MFLGPTGIPTIDCINGYRGYGDKNNFEDTMGDALDYETLNTDFDFAANLALFDKAVFIFFNFKIFIKFL